MQDLTEMHLRPLLDPLCKATETTLKPIDILDTDFLVVNIDDEAKEFEFQLRSLEPIDPYLDDLENMETWEKSGVIYKSSRKGIGRSVINSFRRIPERREGGYGRYFCACTDFTAIVIYHIWPKERIIFESEDARLMYRFLVKRFISQSHSAKMAADFKVNQIVPDMPKDYIEHPELPLAGYQKVGLLTTLEQEASALFMEQGTGKTPVVVNRINLESARKRAGRYGKPTMYRALILCPKQVRKNWEREFERFSVVPGKVASIRGGQLKRQRELIDTIRDEKDCCWGAAIMSIDSLSNSWESIRRIPFDLVVIDESHFIKGGRTNRAQYCHKMAAMPNVKQRCILTGTPIANSVMDLWAQFEFLGEGLSGFHKFKNFKAFHGQYKKVGKGQSSIQKLVGIKGVPLLQERLSRLSFMVTKKEANLGLPDKVYDLYETEMTPQQKVIYESLATKLMAEIEEGLADDNSKVTVDHILTKLLRLAQVCSGFVKPDDGELMTIPGGNPKLDAVVEMLRDTEREDPTSKTIIWACFIADQKAISERLEAEGIKYTGWHSCLKNGTGSPEKASDVFNLEPDCKVIIGNPASGAEGLNLLGYDFASKVPELDTSCNHEIFFSCNWSAVKRSQAEDRAHRRGTRGPVRITDLVIPGTIDEEIRARVLSKRQTALMIQDIRDILKSLANDI